MKKILSRVFMPYVVGENGTEQYGWTVLGVVESWYDEWGPLARGKGHPKAPARPNPAFFGQYLFMAGKLIVKVFHKIPLPVAVGIIVAVQALSTAGGIVVEVHHPSLFHCLTVVWDTIWTAISGFILFKMLFGKEQARIKEIDGLLARLKTINSSNSL